MYNSFLEFVPLWAVFLATAALGLLAVEIGFQLGANRRQRTEIQDRAPVSSMVGATLALLAFVLAFSYGTATANFDTRRQLVVDDANAIGSSYSLAGLLPEPQQTEIRAMLREYVSVRVDGFQPETVEGLLDKSDALQSRIWSEVTVMNQQNPVTIGQSLFVQSLNQMIDMHGKRVAEAQRHVLPTIWITLYFVALISMLVLGYHFGLTGKRSLLAVMAFVLAFAAILWLIADFDRPTSGTLNISQQPMLDLLHKLLP